MEEDVQPQQSNKKLLGIGAIVFVVVVAIASFFALRIDTGLFGSNPEEPSQVASERIEYSGRDGVTALDLLKEQEEVEEQGGYVTAINGRAATEENREYWAFYLNGQLSQLGAEQYVTNDSDEIVWKIEKY